MTNLDAALELAALGWRVLPCHPSGDHAKAPLTRHGHHDATADTEQIIAWWTRWPTALIGAPVPDPFIVLDIDPRNGGSEGWEELVAGRTVPMTATVISGRRDGGRHLYFLRPHGPVTSTKLPPGIDLKANGYCIVPPSLHPATGHPYEWIDRDPVALPPWLREVLRPDPPKVLSPTFRNGDKGLDALVRVVTEAQVGGKAGTGRNCRLFWAACRAVEEGHDLGPIRDAGLAVGLDELEVHRTILSAKRKVTA